MVRVLVAALVVGMVATAAADTQSTKLFEEGRALAKEQKWDEACAKFARSLELDRAPGTLLNYGDCHEHLNHLALAWRLFDEAGRAFDKVNDGERAKFARDRAQALVPKTSTIVVKLAAPDAPGLTVTIGGRTATPASEIREVVDVGEVTVEVSGPNLQPFTKRERAEAGLKIVVEVPKLQLMTVQDTPVVDGPKTQRRRTRVLAAYTLAGVGGVGVIAGLLIGMNADGKYDAEFESVNGMPPRCMATDDAPICNDDGFTALNNAITQANIGTAVGVVGAVLIGGAAVVFLTAPKDVVVIPTATASSGGLAVVGRF
ncbi:MAG TPA: tetratricopeptide repeat protein [Kofleriaceae bacterium]